MSRASTRTRAPKPDAVAVKAVDEARMAAAEAGGPDAVGDHLGYDSEGDRVVTHHFTCTLPGYVGWRWAVSVVRASRAKSVTVNECVLLPGAGSVLSPAWVPWEDRVKPEDLGPGDLLPAPADDPRLEPGYTAIEDPDTNDVVDELGLGRTWVLSGDGRLDAASRWYEGEGGPHTEIAKAAPGPCGTCGFAVPLAGSLGRGFGVCTNERTPFDGNVVSHDHGCGGHSDVRLPGPAEDVGEPVIDTFAPEVVSMERDDS